MGLLRKLFSYLNEARLEMKKINWPSRATVLRNTILVVIFSAVITAILGGFDLLFNKAVLTLISSKKQVAQQFNIEDITPDTSSQPFDVTIGDSEEVVNVEAVNDAPPVDAEESTNE